MPQMRWAIAIASLAVWCTAATYRTPNFVVHAPTPEIAQRVGQLAEHYRREKALQWLGYELPTWNVPVPIRVVVLPSGPGGATSYQPIDGQIFDMQMTVQGPLERIYNSVLPHEITHTVLVSHFRCPLPRWADEGSAVLSEDEPERRRHDQMVRQALAQGRAFRLRVLFNLRDYPANGMDILTLYAQGYSVVRFLVETSGRQAFLTFLAEGMQRGWDAAVRKVYGYSNIEELEDRWLSWMRGQYAVQPPALAGQPSSPRSGQTEAVSGRVTSAARPGSLPPASTPIQRDSTATRNPLANHAASSTWGNREPDFIFMPQTPPIQINPCPGNLCPSDRSRTARNQSMAPAANVQLMPPVPLPRTEDGWTPVPAFPSQRGF